MTFAVAGGGRVSGSFVTRLPGLESALGPVAAQSYRLASRIVNSIGAGHAVRAYQDLNDSTLILTPWSAKARSFCCARAAPTAGNWLACRSRAPLWARCNPYPVPMASDTLPKATAGR